ncbi:MAG: Flp family type IVb pilin [Xanthobacteraceae bacterium]
MQKLLVRFANDESAAAAIEYLLIVAGLSIVIVAVLQRFGIALNSIFMTLNQDSVIITDGS